VSTLPDPDGNPSTPNGLVTSFGYDAAGNLIRETNGEGESTYSDYDAQGQVIVEWDGNGAETKYRYDSEGNLVSITDAEENITSYTYDGLNRIKTETNAFGTRTNKYNVAGNLESITDRNGRIRQFTYDTLDRRVLEEWKTTNNPTVTHKLSWVYDDLGRITREVDGNTNVGSTADDLVDTFTYDGLGRLVAQTNYDPSTTPGSSVRPEILQTFQYVFEPWSTGLPFNERLYRNQFQRTASGSVPIATTKLQYDRLGRLAETNDYDADVATGPTVEAKLLGFGYDTSDNLDILRWWRNAGGTWQNPLTSDFVHDKADRLTDIVHPIGADIVHSYTHDFASRVTTFDTTSVGGTIGRNYTYDNAGQLTAKTFDHDPNTIESYTYDRNGNRVITLTYPFVGPLLSTPIGPNNRLLDDHYVNADGKEYYYQYDPEGNLTRRTDKSSGAVTVYTWDHRNRLIGVETLAPPPAVNFTNGSAGPYAGQDGGSGVLTVEDAGQTVHLTGNAWKRVLFSTNMGLPGSSYTVTADTVLSFDFYSPQPPEVAAIGLDYNNTGNDPIRYFQLAGAETTGNYAGLSPGVSYGGGWQHYEIRLADFTGAYGVGNPLNRFVFVNDNDAATPGAESYFRNVRLTESPPAATSSTSYTYDADGRRVTRAFDINGAAAGGVTNEYLVYDGNELSMTFEGATGATSVLAHRYMHGPQVDHQ